MGITRYEFARRHTPGRQVPFFKHLRRLYESKPPTPLPQDLIDQVSAEIATLPGGQTGISSEFAERIRDHEIWTTDPTGEWRFTIHAEYWRGVVCDRLGVQCEDLRTLPDWTLLVRMRSWVLDDEREAFIWLPDQDLRAEQWQSRYENERFNNLAMISPRLVFPATQSPSHLGE